MSKRYRTTDYAGEYFFKDSVCEFDTIEQCGDAEVIEELIDGTYKVIIGEFVEAEE